ncbi:hypothetical protein [Dyella acidisoli]|uniref:Tse2 ADP-ribosyltransferase toxin domain-containing protein n=1 Tax=Dyella acidisoli TaxID=1867834 RepID=A0ABQ5XLZ5_9GAMM|nr:hypothetical protein [Dyella acidisoli]GLQ91530.1 hypothetical protein GCM10007901_04800 [Dyella acidisoli]
MSSATPFPAQGTVLWGVDVDLSREVFRSGAASKPNVDYLRFIDIENHQSDGRIAPEDGDKFMVEPGQGISLFLERMIPEGMVLMDAATWKNAGKDKKKISWWGIEQDKPIPVGLTLIYDGVPPGHCTLTTDKTRTVRAFLELVAMITFVSKGTDFVGPRSS